MKGPKAILSSSIATALDEFFKIDKDTIESNLLSECSITLHEMKLRPRLTALPNSWAKFEGKVSKAVFSWVWGPAGNWVKDATLTIEGLDITMHVTEDNPEAAAPPKKRPSLVENMEEAAKPHVATPDEISNQGGIRGYIQTQVEKIIDSMKLRVENYQLTIVLPKQQQETTTSSIEGSGGDESIEIQETPQEQTQIVIQGEVLELISLGRLIPTNPDVSGTSLEQELILQNFVMQIKTNDVAHELVEQFSYKASSSRTGGKRFDRLIENLQLQGHGGDLKVHLGAHQLKTLSYVAILLMAPPEGDEKSTKSAPPKESNKQTDDDGIAPGNTASHFDFDLGLLHLTMDTSQMELPNAKFVYRADGTIMKLESDGFSLTGNNDMTVKVSKGMQTNLKTPITLQIGSIDEINVPYTAKLVKPVTNTKIVKEGQSYVVEFVDDVQIEMLKGKEDEEKEQDSTQPPPTTVSVSPQGETKTANCNVPQYKANVVPFPLSVSMKHLILTKEEDDNRTDFHNFYAFCNPTPQGTEFAVDLGKVQNYLLCVQEALVAGKLDKENQINNFRLSAQEVQVTAGHTPGEWAAAFEPKGTAQEKDARLQRMKEKEKEKGTASKSTTTSKDQQRQSQNSQSTSPPMKFPNCYVDPLRLTISWRGAGVSVKDTKVTVKAFQGKADTTANQLVQYYVQSCLAHASDFIPNAELLGLNVIDSTMGTFGNYVGMATLGPLGGIAAIGAVDAVKKSISAGKKSRNRDDGAQTSPLDVFRGIAYQIQQTGHKFEKSPVHLAQDTMDNTGTYIEENKARLGAAGMGGAGMIVGGILGGPAGAIVAGVITQAVTEKVINTLDDADKREQLKVEAASS